MYNTKYLLLALDNANVFQHINNFEAVQEFEPDSLA